MVGVSLGSFFLRYLQPCKEAKQNEILMGANAMITKYSGSDFIAFEVLMRIFSIGTLSSIIIVT